MSAGSASALSFSRPARRSPLLRPICLLNRQRDSLSSEASGELLPPRLSRLLPGGTINLPGRDFHPLEHNTFHGARTALDFREVLIFYRLFSSAAFPACRARASLAFASCFASISRRRTGGSRECCGPAQAPPPRFAAGPPTAPSRIVAAPVIWSAAHGVSRRAFPAPRCSRGARRLCR